MNSTLTARLQEFTGRRSSHPVVARDPVNQAMIRHWCDAIGDDLAVYTDPDAAAASVHRQIIAPPAMLQAWIMPGLKPRPVVPLPAPGLADLTALLEEHGFTSIVATNSEQEYHRELHLGDVLTAESVIESVSDEKQTPLGAGHFLTTLLTFRDQHDQVVGTMRFRVLRFRPRSAVGA